MKLQNIANAGSNIYLFIRNDDMSLEIKEVKNFLPFYYEPNPNGTFIGYDGRKLQRLFCTQPGQIKERRSDQSYESDILFVKRYILERIPEITVSPTVKCFFDIEVPSKDEFPDPAQAKYEVSTIRAWDNKTKKMHNFFIRDLKTEYAVIQGFIDYVKELSPDLLIAWNIEGFDYPYLSNRYPEFAKAISPINQSRYGTDGMIYPSGISVIDLLGLYNKFTGNKKESYALMNVGHDELGHIIEEDYDFTDIEACYDKCGQDVMKMVELDEKYDLIENFNSTRMLCTCVWEDLPPRKVGYSYQSNNSKPLDMLFLREAKKLNIVLPKKESEFDDEMEKIDGAFREVYVRGIFRSNDKEKIFKLDLGSAYPAMLRDFCLDPTTVSSEDNGGIKIDIIERETGNKKCTHWFKQNENAIIPAVARKLLQMKDETKRQMNALDKGSEEYEKAEISYDCQKRMVNSLYGILANRYFRLFNNPVAETTTFLVRDVLHYVKDKVEAHGAKVIYVDTDSVFYIGSEDLTDTMNQWIQEWAVTKYNNHKVNLKFDKEGTFDKLFILALCRYIGYLNTKKGIKKEIKGVQMKRKDSTPFIKKFQEELIDFLFANSDEKSVIQFVEKKIVELKGQDILEIAFPCKMSKPIEDYKKDEIYLRALRNTQEVFSDFTKKIGEKYYWVYLSEDAPKDVFALDKKTDWSSFKEAIDWTKMMERNIFNIIDPIFEGMGWGIQFLELGEKYSQKISLDDRRNIILQYADQPNYLELRERFKIKDKKTRKPKEEQECSS